MAETAAAKGVLAVQAGARSRERGGRAERRPKHVAEGGNRVDMHVAAAPLGDDRVAAEAACLNRRARAVDRRRRRQRGQWWRRCTKRLACTLREIAAVTRDSCCYARSRNPTRRPQPARRHCRPRRTKDRPSRLGTSPLHHRSGRRRRRGTNPGGFPSGLAGHRIPRWPEVESSILGEALGLCRVGPERPGSALEPRGPPCASARAPRGRKVWPAPTLPHTAGTTEQV
eukprot:scaffold20654_cov69-Phaeocystis_antarctica.AAC.1